MRYIALIWDDRVEGIRETAVRIKEQAFRLKQSETIAMLPGLCVWNPGKKDDFVNSHVLSEGRGVVVGSLFGRHEVYGQAATVDFRNEEEVTIVQTAGHHLVEQYWGSYVAFIRDPRNGKINIVRDPTGGLHCYHTVYRDLHIYYSDIRDCLALGLIEYSMNWRYIAVHLLVSILNGEETALKEVRELCPGQCDDIDGGKVRTRAYWEPSQITLRDSIEDPTDAAVRLNRITKYCIDKWNSLDKNILILLSGGVDSSILLGCARSAQKPSRITTFTQFVPGPGGGDERFYSRQAIQAAGCQFIEHSMNVEASLEYLLGLPRSARPQMYLSTLNDAAIVHAARQTGANAIYNGNGGDALFYKHPEYAATDYLHRRGINLHFLKVAYATSQYSGQPIWSVLRAAFKTRRNPRPRDIIHECLKYHSVLTPKAIAIATHTPQEIISPWLRDLGSIPIGKREHILGLSLPVIIERPFCQMDDIEERAVLFSQPIIEECLCIPTDILTAGGLTRAVARSAFVNEVPSSILARNDKGSTQTTAAVVLKRNQDLARGLLLDGLLVNQGLIDREQVQIGLSSRPSVVSPSEVLCHLSTEVWLRSWQLAASR